MTDQWQPFDTTHVVIEHKGADTSSTTGNPNAAIVEHSKRVSAESRARDAARTAGYRDGYSAGLRAAAESRNRTARQPPRVVPPPPVTIVLPDGSTRQV